MLSRGCPLVLSGRYKEQKSWHCHRRRQECSGKVCSSCGLAQAAAERRFLSPTMAKPPKIVGNSAIGVAFSEGARMWPFVFGFATTLGLVTWMSKNLDPKDAQKSPFINPNAHR